MSNKVKIPRNIAPLYKEQKDAEEDLMEESPEVVVKRILKSKTIWFNVVALISFIIQSKTGFIISEELQYEALSLINIALRFVTKEPISWGGNGTNKESA